MAVSMGHWTIWIYRLKYTSEIYQRRLSRRVFAVLRLASDNSGCRVVIRLGRILRSLFPLQPSRSR